MSRAVGAVLLALVLGLTAACGKARAPGVATARGTGPAASATPTTSVDPEEQRRLLAQCLRDHGVDVSDADPEPGGGGGGGLRIRASEGTHMDEAFRACQKYATGGNMASPDPQTVEQFRQFTQCMRDHGIDVPDPDPNGGGGVKMSKGPGGINPDDPKFKAAEQACQDKLPGKGPVHVEHGK
jgi:hypothetical protein